MKRHRSRRSGFPLRTSFTIAIAMLFFAGANLHGETLARPCRPDSPMLINVDSRIELMSIIFRLAGFNEYSQGRVKSYLDDVDDHFQPYIDHEVIKLAQQLRAENGIAFDKCMRLAIYLADGFDLQPASPLADSSQGLYDSGNWTPETAAAFVTAARDFAAQSHYKSFYDAHQDFYDLTQRRMQELLDEHMHLEWFSGFYGVKPEAPFTIVPSIINGPASYGPKYVAPDGSEQLYAIIGVWNMDDQGMPVFGKGDLGTIVHEFNHSFVNHAVESHRSELAHAGELILNSVSIAMARQGYGNWKTIIDESLVRAAAIRYQRMHVDVETAQAAIRQEQDRSFLWIAPLEQLLADYEMNREKYPTFADFMPRVVRFFNDYAPDLQAIVEKREMELDSKRPKIVSIVPATGAKGVDPSTNEITITFDRPMKSGYQCMASERGAYPSGEALGWNEDHTTFRLRVSLEPDTLYAFTLNMASGGSFRSARDNIPLKKTEIWFHTASR